MMIKYSGTNIHALGHIEQDKTKPSYGPQDIHWLRPGWNEFPSHVWRMYEDHPEILKKLKDGTIELMDEKVLAGKNGKKKSIGTSDEPIDLKDLPESKAIEIVKGTYNREMLQRWLDEENRSKVKRSLEEQIKPLLPESKAG